MQIARQLFFFFFFYNLLDRTAGWQAGPWSQLLRWAVGRGEGTGEGAGAAGGSMQPHPQLEKHATRD